MTPPDHNDSSSAASNGAETDAEQRENVTEMLAGGASNAPPKDKQTTSNDPGYAPTRDVPRPKDEPPLRGTVETYPDPAADETAAIDLGEITGGYLSEDEALGQDRKSGVLRDAVDAGGGIREDAIPQHYAERRTELQIDAQGGPINVAKELAAGSAAEQAKKRVEGDVEFYEKRAEAQVQEAKELAADLPAEETDADTQVTALKSEASPMARIGLLIGFQQLFWAILADMGIEIFGLGPSIQHSVAGLSFQGENFIIAAFAALVLQMGGAAIGVLVKAVFGDRPGSIALLVGLCAAVTWMFVDLTLLRQGHEHNGLFLNGVSLIAMLVSAFIVFAIAVARDFKPTLDRIAAIQRPIIDKQEQIDELLAGARKDRTAAENGRAQITQLAQVIEGTDGRALSAIDFADRQKIALDGLEETIEVAIHQERKFTDLRFTKALMAYYRSRRFEHPQDDPEVPAGRAEPITASNKSVSGLISAIVLGLLIVGGAVSIVVHSLVAIVIATALALLVLAFTWSRRARALPATSSDQAKDPPRGIVELGNSDKPWRHLPSQLRSRRGTADTSEDTI